MAGPEGASPVTKAQPPSFLWSTVAPLFMILGMPCTLMCAVSLAITLKSSSTLAFKWGFDRFVYNACTCYGFGTLEAWTFAVAFILYSALSILLLDGKAYRGPPTSSGYRPVYRNSGFTYYVLSLLITGYLLLENDFPGYAISQEHTVPGRGPRHRGLRRFDAPVHQGTDQSFSRGTRFFRKRRVRLLLGTRAIPSHRQEVRRQAVDEQPIRNDAMATARAHLPGRPAWRSLVGAGRWRPRLSCRLRTRLSSFGAKDRYVQFTGVVVDRSGFYLSFGYMAFMGPIYAIPNFYMVEHCPDMSPVVAILVTSLGLVLSILHSWCDHQRQLVKDTQGDCILWQSPAKVIRASYQDSAEHGNNRPAATVGILAYRFEDLCTKKYGQKWKQYCSIVKYKMIPYVY
ncbi:hypothetical protein MRX96_020146 [Rhipicephalus microplus]